MKFRGVKRAALGFVASIVCVSSVPFTAFNAAAGQTYTLNGAGQHKGTGPDGYSYEIWAADTNQPSSMTLGDNGTFTTKWNCAGPSGNFLARRGINMGSTKKFQDYGGITCDFDVNWSASSSGNSRLCIYGWTQNPLVEYYIVEDWKNWCPPNGSPGAGSPLGTVDLDGAKYYIYKENRNSYTIEGNKPFVQYFSVRSSGRTKGTISVSKHFEAWESKGLQMGKMYEVAFNVEGWESNGEASVNKNTITLGKEPDPEPTPTPTPTVEPDTNGNYFQSTFESGTGGWTARSSGSTKVAVTSDVSYDGSKALAVTGRTAEWNGAAIELDSAAFVPGETYSFSVGVLQKSGSTVPMQLSLQQGDGDSASYTSIAKVDAKSGEWTKLENTSFKIPSNSGTMTLYVETPQDSGELTDFYIDVAQGSKSGVKSSVVTGQGKVGSSSDPGSVDPGTTDPVPTVSSGSTGHANRDYTYTKGGSGFKDHAGHLFRLGTSVSKYELNSGNTGKDFILKNYNSITCENEMKPESTVKGVNGTDVTISLNEAKPALDFASQNGLGVRGHTFVWYQQTPEFFFKDGNGYASKATMDKRLENMIKNTFSALKSQYPNLKLYAYDVCNELFINDGGAMRDTLENGGEMWGQKQGSRWVSIYGKDNPEYIINAFKYARQYAPPTCKLYMNDFNEYMPKKRMDLYNMAKKIMAEGDYIDGIGMQSHLSDRYPSASEYEEAIELFASLGLDVQVTELDITNELGGNDKAYPQIFQKIADHANNISSVTLWGTTDERSWRKDQNGGSPLPFSNYQPKSFYNEILNILDKTPPVTTAGGQTPVTTTTTTTTSVTPTIVTQVIDEKEELNKKVTKWGDANNDGTTELADAIFIMQALANPNKYSLTAQGKYNGDVYEAGEGITANDALAIQKKLLGLINTLPESYSSKLSTKVVTVTGNTPQVQTTTTKSQQTVVTNTPSSAGKGSINSNFDSGAGSWSARSASVAATSDAYYGSSGKALEVSGRSQEWNGAAISLGSDFKVGETYSVSLAALQVAKDNATIQISLQQGEGDSASYTSIAKAECKKGTWTKIENTSFTIPDNSGDMILYVETVQDSGDLMDFYIDNVVVAAEGTKSSVTTGGQGKVPEAKTVTTPGVDTSKKLCAIAFDDGASASSRTDPAYRIMDALIKNNMTATFFYVSDWIKTNEQVKFAYQNGMEVANHTKSHPEGGLSKLSSDQIRYQWSECNSKLKSIIGTEPSHLMRLPYLDGGGQVTTALYDVPLIDCAIDTRDWSNASKDQIVQTIKNAANDGSLQGAIVLCHENYATTAAAMEEVLPWLAQNGYQNVSISDMAAAKGKTLQGGVIYKRV